MVNLTKNPIEIYAGFSSASVKSVELKSNHTHIAATAPRLSRVSKLRKVLHELKIDALFDLTPHKQKLLLMDSKYLDVFAKSDSELQISYFTK